MTDLPPFPVDEGTLSLLEAHMDPWSHGNPDAEQSSLWPFLNFMATLGGSDVSVREVDGVGVVRGPLYTERDVIASLIGEVRRLRAHHDAR